MELVQQITGHLQGASPAASRSASRASRLPVAAQQRAELLLVGLLAVVYGWTAAAFEPALAVRSGALFNHLLWVLGAAVVCLGLWDVLAFSSLRHLLRRDRKALWWKYGRRQALRNRLESSSFELDSELAGGLVTGVLRRFVALERPETDFLPRHLGETLQATRIGSGCLSFAISAAPILGLLGAVLELRTVFRNATAGEIREVLHHLEGPTEPLLLGLGISLLATLFRGLLGRSIAEDCTAILSPVLEALRHPISRRKCMVQDFDEEACETRMEPWLAAPWSEELRRYRVTAAILSWVTTAGLLILLAFAPG